MIKAIHTDKAPAALGPYSQAVNIGNCIFVSGQLGLHPETGELIDDSAAGQTRQIMINAAAILQAADSTTGQITQATIYLTDLNDFAAVNEVYAAHLSPPYPARACVQVAALPKGAKVEISFNAIRKFA